MRPSKESRKEYYPNHTAVSFLFSLMRPSKESRKLRLAYEDKDASAAVFIDATLKGV